MSNAEIIREHIELINRAYTLDETEILVEGWLLDATTNAAKRALEKYGDIKYNMLAKVTNKTLDLFQKKDPNSPAIPLLHTLLDKGKAMAGNPAVMVALAGIAFYMFGIASNPASAQSAQHGADLNDIANQMEALTRGSSQRLLKLGQAAANAADVGDDVKRGINQSLQRSVQGAQDVIQGQQQLAKKAGEFYQQNRDIMPRR